MPIRPFLKISYTLAERKGFQLTFGAKEGFPLFSLYIKYAINVPIATAKTPKTTPRAIMPSRLTPAFCGGSVPVVSLTLKRK